MRISDLSSDVCSSDLVASSSSGISCILPDLGGTVVQETRLYDPDRNETRSMRSKEDAHDYRYFPDPDLLPLELDDAFLAECRESLPELPDAKREIGRAS